MDPSNYVFTIPTLMGNFSKRDLNSIGNMKYMEYSQLSPASKIIADINIIFKELMKTIFERNIDNPAIIGESVVECFNQYKTLPGYEVWREYLCKISFNKNGEMYSDFFIRENDVDLSHNQSVINEIKEAICDLIKTNSTDGDFNIQFNSGNFIDCYILGYYIFTNPAVIGIYSPIDDES